MKWQSLVSAVVKISTFLFSISLNFSNLFLTELILRQEVKFKLEGLLGLKVKQNLVNILRQVQVSDINFMVIY